MGKTALVLSAGGMMGAYQAGAWRVLSEWFRPDLVVGGSVGALNGWAIAGGCPPGELVDRWLDARTADLMRVRYNPVALFDPRPLNRLAEDLCRRYPPRIEFAAVAMEVPRMRRRILRDADARSLAASCAIPLGFAPVRIGMRWYVDGALGGIVPLWAAKELGATHVIAINALAGGPTLLRNYPEASLQVATIEPPASLGSLRDAYRWSRDNVLRWIAQGERDAERLHFATRAA